MTRSRRARRATANASAHAGAAAPGISRAASPADTSHAAIVLLVGLALLALARAGLAFPHTMWAWSLNLHRFLNPIVAWLPWAIAALALLPPVGRPLSAWWARAGDAFGSGSRLASLAAAAAGALLVWSLPDQVRFVGDFLIRQGTVEEIVPPGRVWPQALPLDAWLHFTVPLWLSNHGVTDANGAARLIGALEAGALAWLAARFAALLRLRGGAAFAAASVMFFGGALGLFTGYSKAFLELAVLTALIGVSGLAMIRDGRGMLAMGIAFAIAITLHRSAPGFIPALLVAWALWARGHGNAAAWRRPATWAALAIPAIAAAFMLPRIAGIVRRVDPVHFATPEIAAQGGLWSAALHGARPADALNLVALLAPLALLAIPLAVALGRALPRGRELAYLAALALPFVLTIPFVHALGGLFRDYDDFATAGVALAMLSAWLAGETLRGAPRFAWLAAATALAAIVPCVQWLAHHTDVPRGLARIEALMHEPPARSGAERGRTFDYLGTRWYQLERYEESAEAFKAGCVDAPSPRMLQQWALAETMRGNLRGAVTAYHQQLEKEPDSVSGWLGLAAVTSRIPDYDESRRALNEVLRLRPGDPDATQLLQQLAQEEAVWKANGSELRHPLAR